MLANQMCNNDCCITCMCIHVITVTISQTLNSIAGRSRLHMIHTMHISQYKTGMWTDWEKNPAIQLKECRWPRIDGGVLSQPQLSTDFQLVFILSRCVYSYHIWRASWYGSYTMTVSQSELQNCIFQMIQFLIKVISIITHSVLLVIQAI